MIVIGAVLAYARLYLGSKPERSAELVGRIEAQPLTDFELREFRLKPLLAELSRALGETALAAARQRGMALDLNEVVAELLNDEKVE
jgi:hypothetical protein